MAKRAAEMNIADLSGVMPNAGPTDGSAIPLYVITKNDTPCHATFSEQEARQLFDSTVHAGRYRQVAVMMVPVPPDTRVIMEAAQAPETVF